MSQGDGTFSFPACGSGLCCNDSSDSGSSSSEGPLPCACTPAVIAGLPTSVLVADGPAFTPPPQTPPPPQLPDWDRIITQTADPCFYLGNASGLGSANVKFRGIALRYASLLPPVDFGGTIGCVRRLMFETSGGTVYWVGTRPFAASVLGTYTFDPSVAGSTVIGTGPATIELL